MRDDAAEDTHTYTVLVNDEEQYSLWLAELPIPGGWRSTGQVGPKQECLDYVRRVWTDLRPLSLRKALAAQARDDG
ncbi:MAG TPA: MbtH family NRPS accessory protein [Stellaceae bacterium]|nr:MbtH family NRPS accessory protein [Stellaceae bacterium]